MAVPEMLSWQQANWESFTASLENLHHGQIVTAPAGHGLREFCLAMAQYVLCSDIDPQRNTWCGECQNCRLFSAGTHPDFHVVCNEVESVQGRIGTIGQYSYRYQDESVREKKSQLRKVIPIDHIRALIENFMQRPHIARRKVGLILPADRLNINAANALLKLLEEPPEDSLLILLSSEPSRLPPTVLSRCVRIHLPAPSHEQARTWLEGQTASEDIDLALELTDGAPFRAREICETGLLQTQKDLLKRLVGVCRRTASPYQVSSSLNKLDFEEVIKWLQGFVMDMIRWKTAGKIPWWHASAEQDLMPERFSGEKLFQVYDRLCGYRRIARGSLNEELALDTLFLSIQQTVQ
ncbi:MAG: hypothetical protein OXF73_04875 [Gammaproteobacteria bacterium]|nr:hypothetical protein [Gammaproteobacteria bacterium]